MNDCRTEVEGEFALVRVQGEVDLSWSQSVRKAILDAIRPAIEAQMRGPVEKARKAWRGRAA